MSNSEQMKSRIFVLTQETVWRPPDSLGEAELYRLQWPEKSDFVRLAAR